MTEELTKAARDALEALDSLLDVAMVPMTCEGLCSADSAERWDDFSARRDALRAALQDKAVEVDQKSIDWHAVTLSLDEAHDESLDGRHGVARAMLREVCANLRASLPTQPAAQATPEPVNVWTRALEIRMAQGWRLTGDRLPVLYTDSINGDQVMRDDLWLCTTKALRNETPAATPEPAAWVLGDPAMTDSSNVFLAHEFTPDTEHIDEWSPLYTQPAPGVPEVIDEDQIHTIERAADLLEHYATFINEVKPDDIERHPYVPEIELTASDLRLFAAAQKGENHG